MAKRTYTRIESFLSYKFFDRKSREKWQKRWKDRTGNLTARGWNRSIEFKAYRSSIKDRILKYAERAPQDFFNKRKFVLKYSKVELNELYTFGGTAETTQAFLNPMKGKWGLSNLIEQFQLRAALERKKFLMIARVDVANDDEHGLLNRKIDPTDDDSEIINDRPRILTSLKESDKLRGDILMNYGNNVAQDKDSGTYDQMGANYLVEVISNSSQMLLLIDMEIFLF